MHSDCKWRRWIFHARSYFWQEKSCCGSPCKFTSTWVVDLSALALFASITCFILCCFQRGECKGAVATSGWSWREYQAPTVSCNLNRSCAWIETACQVHVKKWKLWVLFEEIWYLPRCVVGMSFKFLDRYSFKFILTYWSLTILKHHLSNVIVMTPCLVHVYGNSTKNCYNFGNTKSAFHISLVIPTCNGNKVTS